MRLQRNYKRAYAFFTDFATIRFFLDSTINGIICVCATILVSLHRYTYDALYETQRAISKSFTLHKVCIYQKQLRVKFSLT